MQKKFVVILLVLVGIMVNCDITKAAPTTYGPTGLIDVPSADVMRSNQMEIGYYHLNTAAYEVIAVPLFRSFEMSGAVRDENNIHTLKTFNLKYSLEQEGVFTPGIAMGVDDIADNDNTAAYLVLSKALPFGLRIHTGIGTMRYKHGFAGLETRLIPLSKGGEFPDLSFMVEHIDKKTSYGFRLATAKGLQFTAGWRDKKSFWGITYTVP
ncbi:YjbH domain-containing protein [Pectinatus sottacetonis]|uniref:YjbH domain-containing protein n=1 Tax=Pectinatus sottacetonis TaxID=1002795 RepID=UPI0018C5C584|nr:YjbH domain-containing protein [Pectinatus sottacetonis]